MSGVGSGNDGHSLVFLSFKGKVDSLVANNQIHLARTLCHAFDEKEQVLCGIHAIPMQLAIPATKDDRVGESGGLYYIHLSVNVDKDYSVTGMEFQEANQLSAEIKPTVLANCKPTLATAWTVDDIRLNIFIVHNQQAF